MIERLLEDRMTPSEAARFETLGRQSRAVRRLYLQTMNMVSNLPHYVASHEWILEEEARAAEPAAKPSMGEAMVLPAMHEQDFAEEEPPLRLPDPPARVPQPPPVNWVRRVAVAAAVAVVAGLAGWGLLRQNQPQPVVIKPNIPSPATTPQVTPPPVEAPKLVYLTATAGATWPDGRAIKPGTVLDPGRTVSLEAGAVEVLFATGSRVVVEGPASFQVTDFNHANLEYGKLVAHVPPAGRGFAVRFGDRTVTDLGTEFGLSTGPQQGATVAVFDGEVVLDRSPIPTISSSTRPATQPSERIHLTRGQVVASTDPQQDLKPVTSNAVQFARSLSDVRVAIPGLAATGVNLTDGQPDSHWVQFKEADGEMTSRPAVMTGIGTPSAKSWVANDPTRSQWLSTAGGLPTVGAGIWIFRTTIDLTGFDPATAEVQADVMVDDALNDIRVNGVSSGRSLPLSSDRSNWRQFHRLTLRGGFKPGKNTLDFVVYNGSAKMVFRAELQGEAMPLAVR